MTQYQMGTFGPEPVKSKSQMKREERINQIEKRRIARNFGSAIEGIGTIIFTILMAIIVTIMVCVLILFYLIMLIFGVILRTTTRFLRKQIYLQKLKNTKRKLHLTKGFWIFNNNQDRFINLIKKNDNPEELAPLFEENYDLSKEQTKYVLNTKLFELSVFEIEKRKEDESKNKDKEEIFNDIVNQPVYIKTEFDDKMIIGIKNSIFKFKNALARLNKHSSRELNRIDKQNRAVNAKANAMINGENNNSKRYGQKDPRYCECGNRLGKGRVKYCSICRPTYAIKPVNNY